MSIPEKVPDQPISIPGLSTIPCTKRLYPGAPPDEKPGTDEAGEGQVKSQEPPAP